MQKDRILAMLRAQGDGFVSGERISRELGITRAAIWKAVDALRRDGYVIDAQAGFGYRLSAAPDVLSEREIRALLPQTSTVGARLDCMDSVDSTNTYLKRAAQEGAPDGTVAVADYQSGGRGRRGRTFQSPKGKGIYLSVLLRPQLPPSAMLPLTALGAVAMCDAVEKVCGIRPQIKWTNDLVLGNRKLCGILTEMSIEGESGALEYAVMGIGINVSQTAQDFDGEVADIATSLARELHRDVSRAALAAAMIEALDRLYDALRSGAIAPYLDAYRRDCLTLGREVRLLWREGQEKVFAEDVDDEFGLIVRHADGSRETLRTGEVSVRGLYGYIG